MKWIALFFIAGLAFGQQPGMTDRMMAFDKNHDGKLTRDEISDERLLALFDRADVNHDGVVTREELDALYAKEGGQQGRGPGGPGGGPGGRGGGRGGFGPPQAGQVMPAFMMDRLNLSDEQRAKIQALQKQVDAQLDTILTADQKQLMTQGGGPPPREPR
jgi:hypothetical protein